jgi:hypothetical protein
MAQGSPAGTRPRRSRTGHALKAPPPASRAHSGQRLYPRIHPSPSLPDSCTTLPGGQICARIREQLSTQDRSVRRRTLPWGLDSGVRHPSSHTVTRARSRAPSGGIALRRRRKAVNARVQLGPAVGSTTALWTTTGSGSAPVPGGAPAGIARKRKRSRMPFVGDRRPRAGPRGRPGLGVNRQLCSRKDQSIWSRRPEMAPLCVYAQAGATRRAGGSTGRGGRGGQRPGRSRARGRRPELARLSWRPQPGPLARGSCR